jgi:hypothetical protein
MKIPRLAPGPPLVALAASPQSFISRQWSLRFSGHLQIDSLPTDIARDDKEQYGGVWITPGQTVHSDEDGIVVVGHSPAGR